MSPVTRIGWSQWGQRGVPPERAKWSCFSSTSPPGDPPIRGSQLRLVKRRRSVGCQRGRPALEDAELVTEGEHLGSELGVGMVRDEEEFSEAAGERVGQAEEHGGDHSKRDAAGAGEVPLAGPWPQLPRGPKPPGPERSRLTYEPAIAEPPELTAMGLPHTRSYARKQLRFPAGTKGIRCKTGAVAQL
jgi:hypothetical protein